MNGRPIALFLVFAAGCWVEPQSTPFAYGCPWICDGDPNVLLDTFSIPPKLAGREADLQAALADAVAFWKGCGFGIRSGTGIGAPVRFVDELDMDCDRGGDLGYLSRVEILSEEPWIFEGEPCRDERYIVDVFRHELGHVLGLGHDPDRESVMYPYQQRCDDRRRADACPNGGHWPTGTPKGH